MKSNFILTGLLAVIFTGCTSAYKAGQTPDDVYYSPAKEASVAKETRSSNRNEYQESTSNEDEYLRMMVRNRSRWSGIDDFDYWYNPNYTAYYNNYGRFTPYYNNSWYTYNRPYWTISNYYPQFGYYYQPYRQSYYNHGSGYGYGGYGNYNPGYAGKNTNTSPRTGRPNLNAYNSGNSNSADNKQTFGQTLRRVISSSNSSYNNSNNSSNSSYSNTRTSGTSTYEAPVRTYNPPASSSSSSSSSGSSSGSSGGSVTRPARAGN